MADDNDTNVQDEQVETTEEVKAEEVQVEAPVEEATPTESDSTPIEQSKPEPQPEVKPEKKESKPVSASLEKIIENIEKLSVLELADLVKALEERFGVSAQAPMMAAGPAAAGAATDAGEEQTTFNVILTSGGANKISVIKAVRELVPTLGLKEAKDLVEGAPKPVLEGVNKETANEAKTKLTAAGGTVELQ